MDPFGPREGLPCGHTGIAPAPGAFGQVTVNLAYWTVDHLRYRFTPADQGFPEGDPATYE